MNVRFPCVAGQFYERDKKRLLDQVTACLPKDKKGGERSATSVMVPHAGLMYSGVVAGELYALLQWTPTVVLLGPNHTGEGKAISFTEASFWRTPLGDVAVDQAFGETLCRFAPELTRDERAHRYEHSLEVQLPFLQYLSQQTKIVPVSVGLSDFETYRLFGEHLAEAVRASRQKILVVASSDMTHYEPHESAKEKDKEALQAILSLDPDRLSERVRVRQISMCGYAPVVAMLAYARKEGASQGELVRYQTSGDASGDYSSVVGYAAVLIP